MMTAEGKHPTNQQEDIKLKNQDLRKTAKAAGIPLWRIAEALGISEPTMTRKLRHELPESEKQQLLSLIRQLAKEGSHAEE